MSLARVLIACFALAAILTVASCITLVQPGERAVVRRFGRVLPEKPGSGLHIGLPWGMDRIDRVKVGQVRTVTVGWAEKEADEDSGSFPPGQMLTGDHNLVNVQAKVTYRVIEEEVDKFVLYGERRTEALIARAAESALSSWLAGRQVDEVLLQGKTILRDYLVERVQDWINDYEIGIRIEQASVPILNPPSQVSKDFDAVGQAHTRIQTQKYEAEQRADNRRRKTQAEVYQIERQAATYVREQQLAAEAEVKNFYEQLGQYRAMSRKDAGYLNARWLDEVTKLFTQMRQSGRLDLLDHHIGADGVNVTQFPLPKRK